MKGFIAGLLFGLVASTTVAFAASGVAHDGTFWTRLTHDSKVSYVDGYLDAMHLSAQKVDELEVAVRYFTGAARARSFGSPGISYRSSSSL